MLVGHEVLIIGEVQGRFMLGDTPELGMRWPAHATSTGKVPLALTQPEPQFADLTRRTPKTVVSRRELEQVRQQGFAVSTEELEVGFTAIAAPVRNHFGSVVGALSVNGPTARLRPSIVRTFVAPLRAAADRVSRRLGATQAMLELAPVEQGAPVKPVARSAKTAKATTKTTATPKSRATATTR